MSALSSLVSGAVGGAGSGVASIANRYLDEEFQQRRNQALADLQHATMVRGEEYMQSAPVQERRQANERNLLEMRRGVELQGKINEASSPELRQARIDDRVSYLEGTTPAEVTAQNAVVEGTAGTKLDAERMRRRVLDPMDVERQRGMANANADASIRVHEATEEARQRREQAVKGLLDKLPEAKKVEFQQISAELKEINKAVVEAQASGNWDPSKNVGQKQLQVQKLALAQRASNLLHGSDMLDPAELDRRPHGSEQSQTVAPHTASSPPAPKPSLMDAARNRAPAPEGSPQAKWEARQQEARDADQRRDALSRAETNRARTEFDGDVQNMEPIELLRKYGSPSQRDALDLPRLARLNQIERTIR